MVTCVFTWLRVFSCPREKKIYHKSVWLKSYLDLIIACKDLGKILQDLILGLEMIFLTL